MTNQRPKFRLGIAAAITSFLVLLSYFVIPLIGAQNSGQWRIMGFIATWGMGLFVVSTLIGLIAALLVFAFKGKMLWQTVAYSGSQLSLIALFYLFGVVAGAVHSGQSTTQVRAQIANPLSTQTEAETITEMLWEGGIREVRRGNVESGLRSMRASLKIYSTEERQAYVLAVDLLNSTTSD